LELLVYGCRLGYDSFRVSASHNLIILQLKGYLASQSQQKTPCIKEFLVSQIICKPGSVPRGVLIIYLDLLSPTDSSGSIDSVAGRSLAVSLQ
jgi:hypothetical protein